MAKNKILRCRPPSNVGVDAWAGAGNGGDSLGDLCNVGVDAWSGAGTHWVTFAAVPATLVLTPGQVKAMVGTHWVTSAAVSATFVGVGSNVGVDVNEPC